MTSNMDKELSIGQTAIGMKDSSLKAKDKESAIFNFLMVPSTKASFMPMNYMEKAILFGLIGKPIKEPGLNLKCTVKANYNFLMEEYIKE